MPPQLDQIFQTIAGLITAPLIVIGSRPISLLWLLNLSLALLGIIIFTGKFKRFLKRQLLINLGIDVGNREAIATLLSYSLGTLGLILILDLSGLNLGSLALVAGGLGVGIGLGLQEIARNLISGITLLLERQLKAGDYVELDNLSGHIKEISMRSTIVHTFDGGDAIVPNSNLIEKQVLNWSYLNLTGRMRIPVSVGNQNDPLRVTEVLLQAAYMVPQVLHDPSPKAVFIGFGNECFNFELWVWINRIDLDQGLLVRSSLFFAIEHHFRHAGITLPTSSNLNIQLQKPDLKPLPVPDTPVTKGVPPLAANQPASPVLTDLLKQLPIFQNCTDLDLRLWLEIGYRLNLEPNAILCQEGEPDPSFYVVLSGRLEALIEQGNRVYRQIGMGEIFGEFSLMMGLPNLLTVRTLDPTTLFVINKTNFMHLWHDRPSFAVCIMPALERSHATLEQKKQKLLDLGISLGIEDEQGLLTWVQSKLANFFKS